MVTVGARTGNPTGHIEECVDLVTQGLMDPSHRVTHRMTFNDVQRAYDMYSEKSDNVIKVVMKV